MKDDSKKKKNDPRQFAASSAVCFALCTYVGYQLDLEYQSEPKGVLGGLALAITWTFYEVWKLVRTTGEE